MAPATDNDSRNVPVTVRTVTLFDILLIVLIISAALFSFPIIQSHQPTTVVIYRDNTCIAEYPLGEDREVTVTGREGPISILIKDEHVSVQKSTCRKQICVKSGEIDKPYEQLVCAPNHILIEIRSPTKTEEKIDAIAQ